MAAHGCEFVLIDHQDELVLVTGAGLLERLLFPPPLLVKRVLPPAGACGALTTTP